MIDALPLLVISLAAFRLTRFLLFDTLTENLRQRFYVWLVNGKCIKHKLLELSSCSWCSGWWISLTFYSLYVREWPWFLGVNGWLSVFAIAAVQGLLHSWEPDDEIYEH